MAITMEEHREYMVGFNLYCDGHMPDACANDQQRKGYRAAQVGGVYAGYTEVEVAQGNGLNADRIAKALTVREMARLDAIYEDDLAENADARLVRAGVW